VASWRNSRGLRIRIAGQTTAFGVRPRSTTSATSASFAAAGPIVAGLNFDAVTEHTAGGVPPDPHLAAGSDYYAVVTNRHFDVYRKTDHADVLSKTLADLFNYTTSGLFDPRILRDPWSGRWFVISDSAPEPSGRQKLQLGVTTTTSIVGPMCHYNLDVNYSGDDFLDYPMLGINQNAVMVTADIYNVAGTVRKGSTLLAFPKAPLLNNCATVTYTIFSGFSWNLTPPVVYDTNANSYLVSAPFLADTSQLNSFLPLYAAARLDQPGSATLTYLGNVSVPTYTLPADAPQCSHTPIDTLDSRFVNASSQWGNSLWNVHTTSDQPTNYLSTPRWYQINTSTVSTVQTGQFFMAGSSSDWNASVAANAAQQVFFTWSSNQQIPCVRPSVAYTGRQASDPLGTTSQPPHMLVSSPNDYFDPQQSGEPQYRWGDYSAVALDPQSVGNCTAGIINEYAEAPTGIPLKTWWKTRVATLSYC
jgi:hypothetical protein